MKYLNQDRSELMEQIIEVLLVEDDRYTCEAFEFCIHRNKKFHLAETTGKQSEGLEILKRGNIGAVILDLELDEGDGINFLTCMKQLNIEQPLVVVITNNQSEITMDCLHSMGVTFIYQKCNERYSPQVVLSIIEHTYPFRQRKNGCQMQIISYQRNQEERYQRDRIEEELKILGFKLNTRSNGYLVDAIYYTAFEIQGRECEMKEVYSVVAKKNKTKDVNVEKSIRDNIERTWMKTAPKQLELYYPFPISKESGAPTNMEFIKNMTRKIQSV